MGDLRLAHHHRPSADHEDNMRGPSALHPPDRTRQLGSHPYLRPSQVPVPRAVGPDRDLVSLSLPAFDFARVPVRGSNEPRGERLAHRFGENPILPGVLGGGRVHPWIASMIDAARGGDRSLECPTRERIEANLGVSVSDPTDQSERAAEAAASAVIAGILASGATHAKTGVLARCPGGCGPVSCHGNGPVGTTSSDTPAEEDGVANVLAQPGASLPSATLQRMQAGFGADFSSVRIHHGPDAQQAARLVAARAFTMGNHIVFGAGEYRPDNEPGQLLLAHELAHVVQQGFAVPSTSTRGSDDLPPAAPPISRAPLGVYRAVETACMAPSEVPNVTPGQSSRLGKIFEVPIMEHYCAEVGCAPFATDYLDILDSAPLYIAFLAAHNPHLTPLDIVELALAATALGGLVRPDILTHKPPRLEYEEIKPDSIAGRAEGRLKQANLAVLFARFSLPYVPGITWSGTGRLPLVTLPGPVEVFLQWHRNRPGLVVYNICVRGEKAILLAYGIAAIILTILLIILSRGKVIPPVPVPVPALAATGPPGQTGSVVVPGEGTFGVGMSSPGFAASPGVATAGPGPSQSLG